MKRFNKKIYNWLSNKHWNGGELIPHHWCYLHHYSMIRLYKDGSKENFERKSLELFGITILSKYKKYD